MSEVLDSYGYVVSLGVPRHEKCGCELPCQRRFRCRSRHHPGSRQMPYCQGGDGESCDECWYKEQQRLKGNEAHLKVEGPVP